MQPSSGYNPALAFALLLVGPPLTGKTNAAFTFPKPYVFDADDKMQNAIQRNPGKQFWYDRAYVDEKGLVVPANQRWNHAIKCLDTAMKSPDVETIIIDSLTQMNIFLVDHILATGASKLVVAGEKVMDLQCWQPFQILMTRLIMTLKSSGKLVVMTCHEETEKDDVTGMYKTNPLIQGALKHKLAGMFTDVWHTETKAEFKDGKSITKYFVRTQPTARMAFGSSLGLPAEFTLTWEELEKVMPKGKQQTTTTVTT